MATIVPALGLLLALAGTAGVPAHAETGADQARRAEQAADRAEAAAVRTEAAAARVDAAAARLEKLVEDLERRLSGGRRSPERR
jgi:hypothetical protein